MSNEFSKGGYIPGGGAPLKVVPYRGPDAEGVPDSLIGRDGRISAHIIWYDKLTLAYVPQEGEA